MPRDRRVIVQVVNGLERAGAERMSVDLARRLDPAEWDVHVVVVRDGALREYVEESGLSLYRTGHGFDKTALLALLKMAIYFRRNRPDIVHTHLLGSDIVGRLAALLAGVPVIVSTQHDMLARPWYYTLYKRLTARTAATVACSRQVATYCREVMRIPEKRLHEIDNGIDVDAFSMAAHPCREPITFGAIGSLTPVKGHRFLIEAFASVADVIPDARLVIAGEGVEHGRLSALIHELDLEDRVELRGIVDDIAGFLGEIDVFVHPSLNEGLPMALLEAMAAARPCITTDVSALPEVVGFPESGVCVPARDVGALSAAMIQVASDPSGSEAMGARAQARVRERYSLERSAEQYTQLYRELLGKTEGGRQRGLLPNEPAWWRATRHSLQAALFGTVLFFIGRALASGVSEAQFESLSIDGATLGLSVGLLALYYLLFAGGLTLLFRVNGYRVPYRDVFKVSFVANLGKYVPGGIWPIAGRVALASKVGVSRQSALVLSVVESAVSVAGGAFAIALASLLENNATTALSPALALVIAVAVPVVLHPRIFGRLVTLVSGMLRVRWEPLRMSYGTTLGIVGYYAITWLVAGLAFRTAVMSVAGDPGAGWLAYSAYYAFASIVGLLVLFAPSGVGAREGALLLVLSGPLGVPMAAAISITARIWSTVVELVISAIALVMPFRTAAAAGDGSSEVVGS